MSETLMTAETLQPGDYRLQFRVPENDVNDLGQAVEQYTELMGAQGIFGSVMRRVAQGARERRVCSLVEQGWEGDVERAELHIKLGNLSMYDLEYGPDVSDMAAQVARRYARGEVAVIPSEEEAAA